VALLAIDTSAPETMAFDGSLTTPRTEAVGACESAETNSAIRSVKSERIELAVLNILFLLIFQTGVEDASVLLI
jgi:hypothetical protein